MPRVIIGASEFGTGLVTDQGPWLFQLIEIDQGHKKLRKGFTAGAPAAEGLKTSNGFLACSQGEGQAGS